MAVGLVELLEDTLLVLFRYANAGVSYIHLHTLSLVIGHYIPAECDTALLCELDGIVHEVAHDLEHSRAVGLDVDILAWSPLQFNLLRHNDCMSVIDLVHESQHRLARQL